jgi:predicted N-acetyltransferase YhbS
VTTPIRRGGTPLGGGIADIQVTELADADLPAVVRLCRSALDLPEDSAEAAEIVARLRERAAHRRTVALLAGDHPAAPDGVVLGSLGDGDAGHVDLIAVDPAARRRGVGRALLAAAERALAALGAGEVLLAGNGPQYAWPGIDVRYTPAVCLAMATGYEHDRTAWNMTADLSDSSPAVRDPGPAEARLAAAGITVRRATPDDAAALADFAREHFSSGWAVEIADSLDRPRAGCHVATRDDEVLGFAAYGSSRPSWFGPTGTAPEAQGSGIGGVLLRRCLRDQRDLGHASAQIGWVGPVPFYSRAAAARIERVFFLYRKSV